MKINEICKPPSLFKSKEDNDAFLDIFLTCINQHKIQNNKNINIEFSIIYSHKPKKNELILSNYQEDDFDLNDDAAIQSLRLSVNLKLKNKFSSGKIYNTDFSVALSFGENKYLQLENNIKKEDNQKNEHLNVLPITPKFRISQMVLSKNVYKELEDVLNLIKLREKIYEDWGFSEVDPIPRAIVNFFGSPGTGKTMAAHALASELQIKILVLNYADIESKYVGDAPKNLVAAFNIAKKTGALLFFDEADSFLGKRITNVSQSADQAINSLRSQLLMLLEEFDGIVVFATNLIKNYDNAFKSRILKHIKFELPNIDLRKVLIQKMIPAKTPLEEGAFNEEKINILAELSEGFSGREIKNAILNSLIASASKYDKLMFSDVRDAFSREKEYLKNINDPNIGKEEIEKTIKTNLDSMKNKEVEKNNPKQ